MDAIASRPCGNFGFVFKHLRTSGFEAHALRRHSNPAADAFFSKTTPLEKLRASWPELPDGSALDAALITTMLSPAAGDLRLRMLIYVNIRRLFVNVPRAARTLNARPILS